MTKLAEEIMTEIQRQAEQNGAILVGTTKIRRTQPVILFGFPYSNRWFFNNPFTLTKRLGQEYLKSKEVQNQTAEILKEAGYRAEYKTILSLFGDFRPLAVAAGLGNWGRNGLVVNKKYGSGILFSAIFTDAPLEVGEPIQPEIEHCTNCQECTSACPANAFTNDRFYIRRCLPYALRGCSECLCSGKTSH